MRSIESGIVSPQRGPRIERTSSRRPYTSIYKQYEETSGIVKSQYHEAVAKAKGLKGRNKIQALKEATEFIMGSDIDLENKKEFLEGLTTSRSNYTEGSYLHRKFGELITKTENNIACYQSSQELKAAERNVENLHSELETRFDELINSLGASDQVSYVGQVPRGQKSPTYVQQAPVSPITAFDLTSRVPPSKGAFKRARKEKINSIRESLTLPVAASLALGFLGALGIATKRGVEYAIARTPTSESGHAVPVQDEVYLARTTVAPIQNKLQDIQPKPRPVLTQPVSESPRKEEVSINKPQYPVSWTSSNSLEEKLIQISSKANQDYEEIVNTQDPSTELVRLSPVEEIKKASMGMLSDEPVQFDLLAAGDKLGLMIVKAAQSNVSTPKINVTTASNKPTHWAQITTGKDNYTTFINTSTVDISRLPTNLTKQKTFEELHSLSREYSGMFIGEDTRKVRPYVFLVTGNTDNPVDLTSYLK